MSDPRDDLAALIHGVFTEHSIDQYEELVTPLDVAQFAADAILAAGYVKPKPPTVTPDHDISPDRGYICDTCDRRIEWDATTQEWNHQ